MSAPTIVRRRLVVRGVVQGVGFRPHVARLAGQLDLAGLCRNDATCVVIEVEGPSPRVDEFRARLEAEAPPLAHILSVETADFSPNGRSGFDITASSAATGGRTLVPPDTAVCDDCLTEFTDPTDRRHRHPFITCTNCGPRFTITLDLPYDRPATTMADFDLCAACASEYADPTDRRYHAQPIGCHDCGPRLSAVRPGDDPQPAQLMEAVVAEVITALRAGEIVAVKGIGGFHLACDAANPDAVARLRRRKHRPDQPFAVLARDLDVAATLVDLPAQAIPHLTGPARPILLLPRRADAPVAAQVAPGLDEMGVLLPYAPLHHLLFATRPDGLPGAPAVLVMTSGNRSGEPLCHTDADALTRLAGIADLFCLHDRAIAVPCEDSVLAWHDGEVIPLRRSRGFAPLPVRLADGGEPGVVLAAGAEIKNTFALARDGWAFVSAHVGDLGTLESQSAHHLATAQMLRFHRATPALVVTDRHPGYASRTWAHTFAAEHDVPVLEVQHHHAHLAALAAEHGRLSEPLLGLVFDGTGYGCDGGVWGGELLQLGDDGCSATRLGHLGLVRLPGGDAGVRQPVRQAALALLGAGLSWDGTPVADALTASEKATLPGVLATPRLWAATSSVGRLFDVVSALLGVRSRISYEAQAAIELEAAATDWQRRHPGDRLDLPLPVHGDVIDPDPMLAALVEDLRRGTPIGRLALGFHHALARAAVDLAAPVAHARGLTTIGLTGGVFVNRLLLDEVIRRLRERDLTALTHRMVPAGDGGLALGQVAVGRATLSRTSPRRRQPERRR